MTDGELGQAPKYVKERNQGHLVLGAQLPTKDGRRMGNAHIIGVLPAIEDTEETYYLLLTDAGSRVTFTEREIRDQFHPSEWVADIDEVLRKFSRPE